MNATSFGPYQLTDSLLVESAIQGDLEAFNELVIEYQDIAYNLAFRIIGNRAAAEDAVRLSLPIENYLLFGMGHSKHGCFGSLRMLVTMSFVE